MIVTPGLTLFARAGEAVAGRGFYETHHLRIGDTVTLHAAGAALRLHLVGRHVEPDGNGNVVIFSRSTLPAAAAARIGGGDVIASFVPRADGRAIQRDLERRSGSRIAGELVSDDVRARPAGRGGRRRGGAPGGVISARGAGPGRARARSR